MLYETFVKYAISILKRGKSHKTQHTKSTSRTLSNNRSRFAFSDLFWLKIVYHCRNHYVFKSRFDIFWIHIYICIFNKDPFFIAKRNGVHVAILRLSF